MRLGRQTPRRRNGKSPPRCIFSSTCSDRTYWLIVAQTSPPARPNISSAMPRPNQVADIAQGRVFPVGTSNTCSAWPRAKSALPTLRAGWKGLLRHMILCQAVLLFVAEQTGQASGGKSRGDNGADRARAINIIWPALATPRRNGSSWNTSPIRYQVREPLRKRSRLPSIRGKTCCQKVRNAKWADTVPVSKSIIIDGTNANSIVLEVYISAVKFRPTLHETPRTLFGWTFSKTQTGANMNTHSHVYGTTRSGWRGN